MENDSIQYVDEVRSGGMSAAGGQTCLGARCVETACTVRYGKSDADIKTTRASFRKRT